MAIKKTLQITDSGEGVKKRGPSYAVVDGHSELCEVEPHCSFDLHFSNN